MEAPLEVRLSTEALRPERGHCWTAPLPPEFGAGDDLDSPACSMLELFEDAQPLGPGHADHNRIRVHGRGLYSHWNGQIYFSSSDNSPPATNGRGYTVRGPRVSSVAPPVGASPETGASDALFPRLAALAPHLRNQVGSTDLLHDPTGGDAEGRIRLLEAKVEYLLDELYVAKSQLRHVVPSAPVMQRLQRYQLQTFDFQWRALPYHDVFLTNPAWREKAADDLCARVGRPREWFAGKKILDCGCGPGRHAWTLGTLGARVTAFDMSDNGLEAARRECAELPEVRIEKRNILDPLPYPTDYDLVWCYGVVHCTGDTLRALDNIGRHARPGGLIYIMVYPEPERTYLESYSYYHEVHVIRQLVRGMPLAEKADFLKKLQGERWALSWFDAISSEINDLYTFEELRDLLEMVGFQDVTRTMPHEHSLNVVAVRAS